MANFHDYDEVMRQLAQDAFNGSYGSSPFDAQSDGGTQLQTDAFAKIGVFDVDNWYGEDGTSGGRIMDYIRNIYDDMIKAEDVDSTFAQAELVEQREQMAAHPDSPPITQEQVILNEPNSDIQQILVDTLASRNETKIANGEQPSILSDEAMKSLKENGIDVSSLEKQFTSNNPVENDAAINSKKSDYNAANKVEAEEIKPVDSITTSPSVDAQSSSTENLISKGDNAFADPNSYKIILDEDGNPIDLIIHEEDGTETALSDITQDIDADDDLKSILDEATSISENDGIYHADIKDQEITSTDAETIPEGNDISVDKEKDSQKYQENFEKHNERYEARKESTIPLKSDTFTAFRDMSRIYNAHKGGIEINGKVPTKVDIAISVVNFYRSNIVETLIVELLRAIVDRPKSENADVDNEKQHIETQATDKFGIQENGDVTKISSSEEAKDIDSFRTNLPEAAKSFGADMTRVDRGSTPDVTIRSTNPSGINGRGTSVTLDNAKRFTFPDMRLVDIKGERLLVDPFGKVLDVVSAGDKYKVGDVLSGVDVSARGTGKEAIETYARDKKISVEAAKEEISHISKERFCDNIESTFKTEAKSIEKTVIPREMETKADLESKLANLNNIERGVVDHNKKAEIAEMKNDVTKAIDEVSSRIDALRARVTDLEHSASKPIARSTNDRFADAVASENKAIGRSVLTTDLGIDKTKIENVVSSGVEAIKSRVEAHNATISPQDRISYDSKSGNFVDRYGISDKGEYVGNTNGKFMGDNVSGPISKSEVSKYVEDNRDMSRFAEKDKILESTNIDIRNEERIDKPQMDDPAIDNAEADKTETDKIEADKAEADKTEVDKTEVDKAEADETELNGIEKSESQDLTVVDGENDIQQDNEGVKNAKEENIQNIEKNTNDDDVEVVENETADNEDSKSADDDNIKDATKDDVVDKTKNNSSDQDENNDVDSESNDCADDNQEDSVGRKDIDDENGDDIEYIDDSDSEIDVDNDKNADGNDGQEDAGNEISDKDISSDGEASDNNPSTDNLDVADIESDKSTQEIKANYSDNENADVNHITAKDAIETQEGTNVSNSKEDLALDITPPEAEVDKIDFESLFSDWKEGFDNFIDDYMKFSEDTSGYLADRLETEIDSLSNIIDSFEGDTSTIREIAHEVVDGFLEMYHGVDNPTSQETIKELATDFFEKVGSATEDPTEFHNGLIKELNNIDENTPEYEFIDLATDGYIEGANANENVDFNPEIELAEDVIVTNEGITNVDGEPTGGINEANAMSIEDAIISETDKIIQNEIETLDSDHATLDARIADVEQIEPTPADVEAEWSPDSIDSVDMENRIGVDIGEPGSISAPTADEAVEAAEGIEAVVALL